MKVMRLYEGDAPGAMGSEPQDIPTLTDYGYARNDARAAVVVCPGGGYGMLADHEGAPIAHWLESIGIRAFVLKYRLGPKYHYPHILGDAHRGIRYVRAHAKELGVDPVRVGILGFSAGGHLTSMAATLHDKGKETETDPVETQSCRPDLAVLIYPVIQMWGPFTHEGSRANLLGRDFTENQARAVSSEKNVALDTAPSFLMASFADTVVPASNSMLFALELAAHHVPFELHVVQDGQHGFGMGNPSSPQDWRPACTAWLKVRKFI